MRKPMRKRIAFLLAFALIMVAAFAPQSASALDTPAPEIPENPPAETTALATTVPVTPTPVAPSPEVTPESEPTPLPADPTIEPLNNELENKKDGEDESKNEGEASGDESDNEQTTDLTPSDVATDPELTEEPEEIEETAIVESESPEVTTVSITGTVVWNGVPGGEVPNVMLSLRGGDGVLRDPVNLICGKDKTYAFHDLPTADTDGAAYPEYKVVAAASRISGYTCKVTIKSNIVTITYAEKVEEPLEEPLEENGDTKQDSEELNENGDLTQNEELVEEEPVPQLLHPTTNVEGSVNWVNVPEGATPGVTITLGGGDNLARDPITLAYGGETVFTFADLPTKDLAGNDLTMYTVTAVADAVENYTYSAIVDGLTVTVTYVPAVSEDAQAAVQAVIDAITAYPSVETIGNMDPTGEPYAAAVRDYHSIMEMISALSEDARVLVTNLSVMENATLKLYILGA